MKKPNQEKQPEETSKKMVIDRHAEGELLSIDNIYTRCHSFKLLVAQMLRNISPFKNDPMIVTIEHCHFFHSFDSYGKEQKRTNAVGGHYHEIDISIENGKWVVKCSPPVSEKWSEEVLQRDRHTHDAVYLKSEDIKLRSIDERAARMIEEAKKRGE